MFTVRSVSTTKSELELIVISARALTGPSESLPVTVNEMADASLAPISDSPIPAAVDTAKRGFLRDNKLTMPSRLARCSLDAGLARSIVVFWTNLRFFASATSSAAIRA
jgi:hypothetical protein